MKLPNLGTMALIAFLLAAYFLASYLAELSDALAGTHKQESVQNSADATHRRDSAARQVCDGNPFEWRGDVLVCYREAP
jgi:hypothetical protein